MPRVRHAIDVAATPEACWKVLTDLTTWPRWFPRARWASVVGDEPDPWHLGGRFEIAFDFGVPVSVKPTVEELDRSRPSYYKVRWVGSGFGITGNHAYTLEVQQPGLTRVTSDEEFSGIGARLVAGPVFKRLDEEVHRSLERFKELVEGRATGAR